MRENSAFTTKLIARAQKTAPDDYFASVARDYLINLGRILFDNERGLFWVIPPDGPAQVATFLPILEPEGGERS